MSWLTDVPNVELLVVTDAPVAKPYQHPACHYLTNTGSANCVAGWNTAAFHATGDVFVQVSDDLVPPANWANRIRQWLHDKPMGVLNLLDCDQARTKCHHPVLTAKAYRAVNTLYPPEFESLWCDDWFHAYHSRFSDYYTSDLVFWSHTTSGSLRDDVAARHASLQRHLAGQKLYNDLVTAMVGQSKVKVLHL